MWESLHSALSSDPLAPLMHGSADFPRSMGSTPMWEAEG